MRHSAVLVVFAFLAGGCASAPPEPPYPAFMQANDLQDAFLAWLPETRSKVFTSDARTRRTSMLLQLPADWDFTTGGAPDKALEIYLLEGDLTIGEFEFEPGGYAYLPSGSMGTRMSSRDGAMLLYFLNNVDKDAVIQTPLITNSNLLGWETASDGMEDFGISTKELRFDPGSGERTWLLKVEPGAIVSWQAASVRQEGFLVSGHYQHSECVDGVPSPGEYVKGGYFLRPAGAINGGPDAQALQTSIWFLRVPERSTITSNVTCSLELAE